MKRSYKSTHCYWRRQCFTYHPVVGWGFIPNLTARIQLDNSFYLVRTNAAGIRSDKDYPKVTPDGRKRIVLLGDSYTAGDGVSNGKRASDLLEQKFPGLDFMNFGLPNTGTDQQLLIYEAVAKQYEADAYIFAVLVENIARNGQSCRPSWDYKEQKVAFRPKPYFTYDNGSLTLHNQPVPQEKRFEGDLGDWSYSFPYVEDYPEDTYAIYRQSESALWLLMKAILNRFINQIENKPVFIVPLPMYDHFINATPPHYLERFNELNSCGTNIHVLDVLPHFKRLSVHDRQRCRFPNDPHYSPFGHEVLAEALEYEIRSTCSYLLDK